MASSRSEATDCLARVWRSISELMHVPKGIIIGRPPSRPSRKWRTSFVVYLPFQVDWTWETNAGSTCLIIGAAKRRYIYWRCASIVSEEVYVAHKTIRHFAWKSINWLAYTCERIQGQSNSFNYAFHETCSRAQYARNTGRYILYARKLNPRKIVTKSDGIRSVCSKV